MPLPERLANKITWSFNDPPDSSMHLIWTGAKSSLGYPYSRGDGNKVELVSHILWRHFRGSSPKRLINQCGRRDCVAPGHFKEA